MARLRYITRVLKPALYVAAPLPPAWIVFALFTGRVEGDQVKYLQHGTGLTVLVTRSHPLHRAPPTPYRLE